MTRPYAVSCHCGAVRLSVGAELTDLEECNCSTCGRSGFLHWQVPAEAVRLLTQKRALTPICGAMPAAGRSSARPAALT